MEGTHMDHGAGLRPEEDDFEWIYNKQRTIYLRPAPGHVVVGLSLAVEILDRCPQNSVDEGQTAVFHFARAMRGTLAETDGFVFEPTEEALASELVNPFANVAVIDGVEVSWTVVDPATEPMVLKVTRSVEYSVESTYVVRMTRAEYEEVVDANAGIEEGALDALCLTTHRGSRLPPDPRVTFVEESEELLDRKSSTELVDEDSVFAARPPRPPYLDEATDGEIRAEIQRRLAARAAPAETAPAETAPAETAPAEAFH